MNAPAVAMLRVCEAPGFDTGSLLMALAVGLALGIAAVLCSRRAIDQDDFPSDPYEREFAQREQGDRR